MITFKALALFTALTLSVTCFANGLPIIDIQNLDGRYSRPAGNAIAGVWKLPNTPPIYNANFRVTEEQGVFVFEGDAGDFELNGLPDSIVKMKTLNWKGAGLKSGNKSLTLLLKSLTGSDESGLLLIKELKLVCKGTSTEAEASDAVFDVCLKSSVLKSKLIDIYESKRANSRTVLENLNMTLTNGSFNLKVKAKFDITANLKANGKISFIKRANGSEIRIRLDKVKASFLNVTKKVFEAIEDEPTEGVRVERPYIIIDLD